MSETFRVGLEAQLRAAENQIAYFRGRVAALEQHVIDRDVTAARHKAEAKAREIDLDARIAGLEDELRQARQRPVAIEEVTDAE